MQKAWRCRWRGDADGGEMWAAWRRTQSAWRCWTKEGLARVIGRTEQDSQCFIMLVNGLQFKKRMNRLPWEIFIWCRWTVVDRREVKPWKTQLQKAKPWIKGVSTVFQDDSWYFSPAGSMTRYFGYSLWEPGQALERKLHKSMGARYDRAPLEYLTLRLVYSVPPAIRQFKFQFFYPSTASHGSWWWVSTQVSHHSLSLLLGSSILHAVLLV